VFGGSLCHVAGANRTGTDFGGVRLQERNGTTAARKHPSRCEAADHTASPTDVARLGLQRAPAGPRAGAGWWLLSYCDGDPFRGIPAARGHIQWRSRHKRSSANRT